MRVSAAAEKGTLTITLTEEEAEKTGEGMPVYIGEKKTAIEFIQCDDTGNITAVCHADIPDGKYTAEIVTESMHPIRFLLN